MRALLFACAAGFAFAAISVTSASTAAPPDWAMTGLKKAAGPSGGVTALVRSKTRLYASTNSNGDLFRSDDGGVTWKAIHPTGLKQKISDLVIDPTNPDRLWAAAYNWGVYRTADGGKTWAQSVPCYQRSKSGCSAPDGTSALAVDPTNPRIVYAGARGNGLYKSTDGGVNWDIIATGLKSDVFAAGIFMYDPTTIFVHPRNPKIVLVGIGQTGIFRSTDGGLTFTKAMGGIKIRPVGETAAATLKTVGEFVYDPATKNVLVGMKTAVYRSTNDGASWAPSGKGLPTNGLGGGVNFGSGSLQRSPVNPKLMVYFGSAQAFFWGSADGGRTWKRLSTSGMAISASSGHFTWLDAAVFDSRRPTTIYVGTWDSGVYRTTTGAGILGGKK